jgi:phenylacetate-CoA ligase
VTRPEIESAQLDALRTLLAEILPGNRFYAAKLAAAGVGFDVAGLSDFTARFPFTTKAELAADQQAHAPWGTNLTYPLAAYTRFHQTSGTTAGSLRWLDTPASWDALLEGWCEVYRAAGVGAGDRVYFAFSFGPFLGFWMAFESAQRLGCLCLPGGGLVSVARLRAILDNGATVLCCTPSYAIRLGEVARAEGLGLGQARVRQIIVAGEPGGSIPATRARITELWPGAGVFDHHGMTETGPVTYECPARPGVLHVIESACLAEVVEPVSGRPVVAGEPGELVLTTLGRAGSPVLRYRTGDLVRREPLGQACACARWEMALAGGILGRVDDMVIVRGVNLYPAAVEQVVRGFPEVAEFQVTITEQRAMTELEVTLEPVRGCADADALAAQVEGALARAFALRIPVACAATGALPRFEMKARRWVRGGGNPKSE